MLSFSERAPEVPEEKRYSLKSPGANRPYEAITIKVKFGGTAARFSEHCFCNSAGKRGRHCFDARAASRAGISAFYEFLREEENIALSLFIAFSYAYLRDQNLHMPREEKNTLI